MGEDEGKSVVVGVERSDGTKVVAEFDSSVVGYFKRRIEETKKPENPCPKCGGEIPSKGRLTSAERKAADDWYAITGFEMSNLAVSYTHLTLPTILLV